MVYAVKLVRIQLKLAVKPNANTATFTETSFQLAVNLNANGPAALDRQVKCN